MKQIRKAVVDGFFLLNVEAQNLQEVFLQATAFLTGRGSIPNEVRDEMMHQLVIREEKDPTAIGNSVAIPHLYRDWFEKPIILFVQLAHPMNLGAPDGIPTQFFFFLLGPPGKTEHLDLLMHIAQLTADERFRYEARMAKSQEELLAAIDSYLERSAPSEKEIPTEKVSEELKYTGVIGGGLWLDIRRRAKWYWSDIVDGFHPKTVSSTFFLVFACLAPAITFGGFMADETNGAIGAVEMIAASVLCGVIYSLLAGQPLIILGGTGPLLIFTAILYQLCGQLQIEFLPTYAWVGLWTTVFLIILSVTDASCLMRYFTRFTDEIFAALISLIFITEAIKSIIHVFTDVYQGDSANHDRALLALLLALGTYYLAMNLSAFRRSRYLRPKVREFLADFGPAIALAAMTCVALALHQVPLDKLEAPDQFSLPSQIPFLRAPMWVWFASAIPALLGTILLYLDQNITGRLVNSPNHKLEKGGGYHLDMAVVGGLIGVCSLYGLPWLVAATVRSLNHVRSLATVEEVVKPGGETKEKIIHTRETRVSGFMIHLLIGVSLFFLPLLQEIPKAVLWGLFLYMGVVSIRGNQFFERLSLWVMDRALYPATHYVRMAPLWVVHWFTAIQVVCLALLWIVKASDLGILFPLFIALLAPLRFLLDRFFNPKHLEVLDLEEDPEEEEEEWV